MSVDSYLPGLSVGQGANLALKTEHGTAVEGDLGDAVPGVGGIDVAYQLTVIRSDEQLLEAFNLSASAGFSGLFLDASTSDHFLNQSSYSRYRTYVVARCIVSLPDRSIRDPKLKAEARALAERKTKDYFTKIYGSEYLRGLVTGGAYFGVIEIDSTSSREQEDIAVAVSASGWGAEAEVSVSKKLEAITKNMSTRVFVFRQGGDSSLPNPSTPDEIISQAAGFAKTVESAPVLIKGIYQRYDQVFDIEFGDEGGGFAWDVRTDDLQTLGRRYLKLKQLSNDYNFVIQHYNDYITGSGVVFEIGETTLANNSMDAIDPGVLKALKVESDAADIDLPSSDAITIEAVTIELAEVNKKISEICEVADKIKHGEQYDMPAPYIAKIGLPTIRGKNMELELIKKTTGSPRNHCNVVRQGGRDPGGMATL